MLYIITSLFFLTKYKKIGRICLILFGIMLITNLCAYLVGRQLFVDDVVSYFTSLYTIVLLSILFLSYKEYKNPTQIELYDINLSKLNRIQNLLWGMAIVAMVVDGFILFKVFPLLSSGVINVQEFKNEGGAMSIIDQFVPHIFVTFSNIISTVGYFFLSLHFYYLSKGLLRKSIYSIVLSSVIILSRLIVLSRSSSIEYASIYLIMFAYVYPLICKSLRKKYLIILGICGFVLFLSMSTISNSRFDTYFSKNSKNIALLDETENPVIFSTFDYYSQWVECGDYVLKRYSPRYLMYGEHSFSSLLTWFQKKIEDPRVVDARRERKEVAFLGDVRTSFPGFVARLVADFGLLGSFFFVLIFASLIKRCKPVNGVVSFKTLLALPISLNIVALFWAGNFFSSITLQMAIIFSLLIYKSIKR